MLSLPNTIVGKGGCWMQNDVECPKCNSPTVRVVSAAHPVTYECADCGHGFVRGRHMLLDE